MNRAQAAFLASLLLTFSFLAGLFHLLIAKLDVSRLILIGLPPPDSSRRVTMSDFQAALSNLRAVNVPGLGTYDLVQFATSPAFLFTAAIVAATAFYAKVLHTGRAKPLSPTVWQEYPLEKKIVVSHNTAIYRFTLPHKQDVLGLPVGQHISISAEINGKDVVRSYTPISNDDDRGFFDLLIKSYEKGNVSRHFAQLKLGDKIRVKGPKGNFQYSPGVADHISMIAGGTGITPMIQIIRAALRNPFDKTTVTLIYANVNEDDILLRDDLEELLDVHDAKFKIFYVLNNPPPGWKGGVGFVTKDHIKEHLPNPATTNSKLLICGPPPMVGAMKKNLEELKYPAPRTVSKLADKIFVF
ncbi:NADH-cytochrome b5 reductase 1 [Termitomyces sp. T112]|nr:NADH-cytochrome b5 reductase 1 [Termitomyces sp. T112]KAH0590518.1 hypothetical protein H2248_000665 [Termitomyces sp. 'cryptogamus']KNZ73479.1 NADH-cytochrome b5 reductase 1 [Termitomyces sp. J132]